MHRKKRNCRHRINRFNFRWETFQHRESSVPLNIKCISNCDIKINVELKDRFFQKSNSLFFSWNQLTDSARAEMTFPKVVKLLLILAPSLSRVPLAPVDSALSDPAKSTNEILLTWKYWEQLVQISNIFFSVPKDDTNFENVQQLFKCRSFQKLLKIFCNMESEAKEKF